MRGGVRGLVVGVLGLTAFYNVLTVGKSAQGGLDALAGMPAAIARWLISPNVPLIPERKSATPDSTGSWAGGNGNPSANGGSWGGALAGPGLGGAWPSSATFGGSGVPGVITAANQSLPPAQFV